MFLNISIISFNYFICHKTTSLVETSHNRNDCENFLDANKKHLSYTVTVVTYSMFWTFVGIRETSSKICRREEC